MNDQLEELRLRRAMAAPTIQLTVPEGFVPEEDLAASHIAVPEGFVPEDDLATPQLTIPEGFVPEEENSFFGNIMRGIGERAVALPGNVIRAVTPVATADVETGVDEYAIMREGLQDDPAALATFDKLAVPITQERTQLQQNASKVGNQTADALTSVDLGYKPQTSWESVKSEPLSNVLPFIVEQGLVSVPDMVAAGLAPPAYGVALTGEIAHNRAKNDGRENATVGDLVAAMPAAAR